MRKMWISCILAAAMILLLRVVPVMAEGSDTVLIPIESNEPGSITIQLGDTHENRPKGEVSLAIVQVADVVNGKFVIKEKYKHAGVDLNDIQNANELKDAAKALQSAGVSTDRIVRTDDSGIAVISNLPVGVYLIYAVDIADYEYISAALISIPTFNKEDSTMVYDIELFPKHSAIQEPPKTGDSGRIWQYGVMMALALTLVIGAGIILRYKKIKK